MAMMKTANQRRTSMLGCGSSWQRQDDICSSEPGLYDPLSTVLSSAGAL
jgi:hypothetical protein